jgi:hypothetical protein
MFSGKEQLCNNGVTVLADAATGGGFNAQASALAPFCSQAAQVEVGCLLLRAHCSHLIKMNQAKTVSQPRPSGFGWDRFVHGACPSESKAQIN